MEKETQSEKTFAEIQEEMTWAEIREHLWLFFLGFLKFMLKTYLFMWVLNVVMSKYNAPQFSFVDVVAINYLLSRITYTVRKMKGKSKSKVFWCF